MFKFKDILAIILGAGIFRLGSIFGHSLSLLWRRSNRDYLDHLLPLQNPGIHHELADQYPSFHSGLKLLGKKSFIWGLLGTFSVSAWMAILKPCPPATIPSLYFTAFKGDILLACIASGVVLGLGLGIIFNAGGTTGGTDILARIFNKYTSLTMGKLMLIVDAIVLITVVVVFQDVPHPMYTLFFIWLTPLSSTWLGKVVLLEKASLLSHLKPEEIAQKRYLTTRVTGLPLSVEWAIQAVRTWISSTVSFHGMRWNKWKTSSIRLIHSPLSPFQKPMRILGWRFYFR